MIPKLTLMLKNCAHEVRLWKRLRRLSLLRRRWDRRLPPTEPVGISSDGRMFRDRISTRVINLEKRPDRLLQVTNNLEAAGIPEWIRINGVDGRKNLPGLNSLLSGSIGCEIAHIAAISLGAPSDCEAIMVCEDDLEFLASPEKIGRVIEEFLDNPSLDVLCLSGRPRGGSIPISRNLRVVVGLVGRGCYLAKPHMVIPLIEIFSRGLRQLERGRLRGKGDLEWREAQEKKYFFAAPREDVARQAEGYSDIENRILGTR